MTLETADLLAVVTLADELHFGRAAERLHVSQPALSKQIQRVEAKVGGPLFVRGYRDVQATEAGRLLAGNARHLLQVSQARSTSPVAPPGARRDCCGWASGSRRSSISCRTCCCGSGALTLASKCAFRTCPRPRSWRRSSRGDIDVGFVRLPVTNPNIAVRAGAARSARRRHAARDPMERALGFRSLAGQPFVVCARSSSASYYDHVVSVCRAAGFAPAIAQETDELYTVLALVRAGIGVGLVPAAARGMRLRGIRFRDVGPAPGAVGHRRRLAARPPSQPDHRAIRQLCGRLSHAPAARSGRIEPAVTRVRLCE